MDYHLRIVGNRLVDMRQLHICTALGYNILNNDATDFRTCIREKTRQHNCQSVQIQHLVQMQDTGLQWLCLHGLLLYEQKCQDFHVAIRFPASLYDRGSGSDNTLVVSGEVYDYDEDTLSFDELYRQKHAGNIMLACSSIYYHKINHILRFSYTAGILSGYMGISAAFYGKSCHDTANVRAVGYMRKKVFFKQNRQKVVSAVFCQYLCACFCAILQESLLFAFVKNENLVGRNTIRSRLLGGSCKKQKGV